MLKYLPEFLPGAVQRKDASIPELVADILCELKPEEQKVIYDLILTALKLLDGKGKG